MMNNNEILNLSLEIEGLVRILDSRDDAEVYNLLKTKIELLHNCICECDNSIDSATETNEPLQNNDSSNLCDNKMIYDSDERPQIPIDEEERCHIDASMVEMLQNNSKADIDNNTLLDIDNDNGINDISDKTDLQSVTANAIENSESEVSTETDDDNYTAGIVQIDLTDDMPAVKATGTTLRLDDELCRREASDLRRIFTLNDKFRFRRELFCNNDPLFIKTLQTLNAMQTYDDALKYLYNNLGWDSENEDVKDFCAIIAPHWRL